MHNDILRLQISVRDVLLNVMIDANNQFEKREYFILSQLLWAIDNYPAFGIPYTRLGIVKDHGSYLKEMVIRFEETFLGLGMEGIERTAMGSDSYEKEYLSIFHGEAFKKKKENLPIGLGALESWYKDSKEFISSNDVRYTIEYFE